MLSPLRLSLPRHLRAAALVAPAVAVALAVLSACAPTTNAPTTPIRLVADSPALQKAAARALKTVGVRLVQDADAPLLTLRDKRNEKNDSTAADGSVGSYLLTYTLFYKINGGAEKTITRERSVNHNENRYLASRLQRQDAFDSLRRNALMRLLYVLPAETAQ